MLRIGSQAGSTIPRAASASVIWSSVIAVARGSMLGSDKAASAVVAEPQAAEAQAALPQAALPQAAEAQAAEAKAALPQAAEAHAAEAQAALPQAAEPHAAFESAAACQEALSNTGAPVESVVRNCSRPAFGLGGFCTWR